MLRTLRGYVELEITGASPERCLNRLAEKDIPFWNLQQVDAFHLTCCLYAAHLRQPEKRSRRLSVRKRCFGSGVFLTGSGACEIALS